MFIYIFYKYKYTNVFLKYKDKYSHIVYIVYQTSNTNFFGIFSIHKTQLLYYKCSFIDNCRSFFSHLFSFSVFFCPYFATHSPSLLF